MRFLTRIRTQVFWNIYLTDDEIKFIFPAAKKIEMAKQLTGSVPFYMNKLITKCSEKEEIYASQLRTSIGASINTLKVNTHSDVKDELYENMIRMLLLLDFKTELPSVYDRKFFFQVKDTSSFHALFPLAESVWRDKIKDKFLDYINRKEEELRCVYNRDDTSNDTKGRLFEIMVLQRFIEHGVQNFPLSLVSRKDGIKEIIVSVPCKIFSFKSQDLPQLTVNNDTDGVYIPLSSTFPNIDNVWKTGSYVFGVQAYTSSRHKEKATSFEGNCRKLGWFDTFNVFFVYLSPNVRCMMTTKPKNSFHDTTETGLEIGYITMEQVECLKNMQLL